MVSEEKEVKNAVIKILRNKGCKKYSFEEGEKTVRAKFSVIFSADREIATAAYDRLDELNFYAMGWLMSPLASREENEFKIGFEKV